MLSVDPTVYSYPDVLGLQSDGQSKGERTRARLMQAACDILNDCGPAELKVSDICARAGLSNGTFYLYFADRVRLLEQVLEGFVLHMQDVMRAVSRDAQDPTRAATAAYMELFRLNRGLMRCLIHHTDNLPVSKKQFHKLNRDWVDTVVAAAQVRQHKSGAKTKLREDDLRRRAHALGGMVDQYLSSLYLSEEAAIVEISSDPEAVLDTLTTIWKRGMSP